MQFLTHTHTKKKNIKLKKENRDIICFYSSLSAIWNRHRNGSGSQCHSGIKKLSLLLHHVHVRSWEHERWMQKNSEINQDDSTFIKPKKEEKKTGIRYAEFFEFDRQTQRCVKNNGKWEKKNKNIVLRTLTTMTKHKTIECVIVFCSDLIYASHILLHNSYQSMVNQWFNMHFFLSNEKIRTFSSHFLNVLNGILCLF